MKDEILERFRKMDKTTRDEVAKQMIFDCAMELEYHYENLPHDLLSTKLLDALKMMDMEGN